MVVEATSSYEWFLLLVEDLADRWVLAHPEKLRIIAESKLEFANTSPLAEREGRAVLDTVTLKVTDETGLSDTATTTLTINSLPPVANANTTGTPYVVDENSTLLLSGSISDPAGPLADPLTFAWDLDGDSIFGEQVGDHGDETILGPVFNAADLDGPAVFDVTLRATDDEGETHEDTAPVSITNVATAC